MPACIQNTSYDPDAEDEPVVAALLELPYDLRGPSDGRPLWHGQRLRLSGRYANRGGFRRRAKDVFVASGYEWFFNLRNPAGRLYFMQCASCRTNVDDRKH